MWRFTCNLFCKKCLLLNLELQVAIWRENFVPNFTLTTPKELFSTHKCVRFFSSNHKMQFLILSFHNFYSRYCFLVYKKIFQARSVCRFKSQPYLAPSSGISIVWRAESWLCPPNDGDATRCCSYGWLLNLQTLSYANTYSSLSSQQFVTESEAEKDYWEIASKIRENKISTEQNDQFQVWSCRWMAVAGGSVQSKIFF